MDAETQKAESGREHQKRATLFNAAEQKVQQLEQRLRRNIAKSRPYFEEKALCQGQLATQKERVESLQQAVAKVKSEYAESLKELERISEEIHYKRGSGSLQKVSDDLVPPHGPREPGVGAELNVYDVYEFGGSQDTAHGSDRIEIKDLQIGNSSKLSVLTDYELELDRCDLRSLGSLSVGTSSAADLETLKVRVRELAVRPVDGGEGQSSDKQWENELNATVDKLDKRLLQHESDMELAAIASQTDDPPKLADSVK
ncbi:SH3 domain-binding protein 5 [Blattella germanica]|nr:SH3 domain-binding protein 5 [Blattella germanica]